MKQRVKKKDLQKTVLWAVCIAAAALSGLWGCGFQGETGKGKLTEEKAYTIGVVTKSKDSEYWLSVSDGMEMAAEELGARLIVLTPDTETDLQTQKRMIEDLLKMDIDALAVSPIDSYSGLEYLQEAQEKGVRVYAYDTPIAEEQIPYIGIDNKKAGYELAEVLAETIGYRGKVGVVSGDMRQACHKERVEGFVEYMDTQKEITVEMIKSGYSNLRVSEKEMQEIQQEFPDLDGLMATSAVTGLGLAEALEGFPVAIVSVDLQEDAVQKVEEGRITALANQSGWDIGYETISYIMADEKGEEQEPEKILDAEILTKENIQKAIQEEEKRSVQIQK